MTYYSPTPEENEAYKQLFQAASRGQSTAIGGKDAVQFFVASGVPIQTLKQIWAIASNGQKEMGPREFSTAMRLIALAQQGQTINENTLNNTSSMIIPAPSFQNIEIKLPPPSPAPSSGTVPPPIQGASWIVSSEQKSQYEKLWQGLTKNQNGMLEGKDAAAFFAKSGQNREVLRNVWQLADVGGDGMMDLTEFIIGVHLTMMAKKGMILPNTLPQELLRSASGPSIGGPAQSLNASLYDMGASSSSTSLLPETNSSKMLQKQKSSNDTTSGIPPPAAATLVTGGSSGYDDYDSIRADSLALNSSIQFSTQKIDESRQAVKAQISRSGNELNSLKSERERLIQALQEATNNFQSDMEKLRELDSQVAFMREELASLRQSVDSKRSAIGAQQDLISNRLDEFKNLNKQMMSTPPPTTTNNGAPPPNIEVAGQKRRPAPDPYSQFSDAAPPSSSNNAFDAFDQNPYGQQ